MEFNIPKCASTQDMGIKMQNIQWVICTKYYRKVKGLRVNYNYVNGANDPTAISAMWKTHFESLLNNVTTYAKCERVCTKHRIFVVWK